VREKKTTTTGEKERNQGGSLHFLAKRVGGRGVSISSQPEPKEVIKRRDSRGRCRRMDGRTRTHPGSIRPIDGQKKSPQYFCRGTGQQEGPGKKKGLFRKIAQWTKCLEVGWRRITRQEGDEQ